MDAKPLFDLVARVNDDFIAFLQTIEHLGFHPARRPYTQVPKLRAAVFQDERRPVRAASEQSAGGHFQDIGFLPGDDARFHAEVIAETWALFQGRKNVGDDIDPLFLNAQCGDLEKARRFDQPYDRFEGRLATPLFQEDPGAGSDGGAIPGKNFDDHFEVGGIAQFKQNSAGGNHP